MKQKQCFYHLFTDFNSSKILFVSYSIVKMNINLPSSKKRLVDTVSVQSTA